MKRRKKRLFAVFLAASLLCAGLPQSAQAASFSDVPGDAWYREYVYDLVGRGIIQGTSATRFSPSSTLTRGAFVTMLAKTVLSSGELQQYQFKGSFKDVPTGHWANSAINWASESGVVNGYPGNLFRPDKSVSRQEMAVMVANFSKATGRKLVPVNDTAAFSDSGSIAAFARSSVQACQRAGVISGYPDNSFRPQGVAVRSEAASMYSKFLAKCQYGSYKILRKRVSGTPVRAVEFDPSAYIPDVVMGRDLVDGGEFPGSMISRSHAVIAVNAAFFDMSSYQAEGTLIKQGRVLTVQNMHAPAKPAFVMDSYGNYSIESFSTLHTATLFLDDGTESTLKGVIVNRWPSSKSDATRILFTRDWGHELCFPARDAVTIDQNGYVTAVAHNADVAIPEKGYVLAQRCRRPDEGNFFDSCKVGDYVAIDRYYDGAYTQELEVSVGAGPRLVKDGQVYGNADTYRAEGFRDPGITSYDALRSCIGIRGDGRLVIVTAYTNLAQLSKIMINLGCTDAMNLDGGGSSNIYVDGQWLRGPQDRKLNSMLIFK